MSNPAISHEGRGILSVLRTLTTEPWGNKLQKAKEDGEVPNALTQLRLVDAPVVVVLLLLANFVNPLLFWAALVAWIVGCISDWLDGKWSRGWGQVTEYGKYWDPKADKRFTLSAIATMAALGLFPSPWSWLIGIAVWLLLYTAPLTYRELHVTHLRDVYMRAKPGGSVAADKTGKYKTALIMIGVSLVLFSHALMASGLNAGWVGVIGAVLMIIGWCFAIYSWLFVYEKTYRV